MKEKNIAKGIFLVACGASSYGMLASFVKLAYKDEYTTAEVTFAQIILGLIGVFLINIFRKKHKNEPKITAKDIRMLILSGTSIGFTSTLYYLSVSYINASIAVVLLMQSVWIGVVVESLIYRTLPSKTKVIAVILILFGTVLATNIIGNEIDLDYRGVILGFLAACSFSIALFSNNFVAPHLPATQRSLYMLLGATIIVSIFVFITQVGPNNSKTLFNLFSYISDNTNGIRDFDFSILFKWGLIIAIFGTIIPPIFLNMGFPHIGIAMGSIISSIELPISVTASYIILNESVVNTQWLGIFLILFAIILMNLQLLSKKQL